MFKFCENKISSGFPAVATALIAQNLPGPAPYNALRVLQISPKSVHFRWNYSRTRAHRRNAR